MNLPTIKNAFQNIKKTCQNRLEEIYPGVCQLHIRKSGRRH